MTLQFEETTPGVHMAMWESPNSGNARTVVIIESLGQFTLYIDGDVAARDLDSFDTAASRAQTMLTSGGSRRMVQMASALVVFAAVGGAAIGVTHLLSGTSGIAAAVASKTESIVKEVKSGSTKVAEATFTTFKPVKPRNKSIVVSTVEPTSTTASVPSQSAVEPVVINSSLPATTEPTAAEIETTPKSAGAPEKEEAPVAGSAEPAGPRIFSATRPVFGGTKQKQVEADVLQDKPVAISNERNSVAVTEAPKPVAIETENEPSTVGGSNDLPKVAVEPEALPLPDRNPELQTAAANQTEERFVPVPVAPVKQAAPNPYETNSRPSESADATYQQLMRRAAAKRHAKLEERRRKLKAKKHKSRKVVKKKRYTKKDRRVVRRRARRVMRCMAGTCRWVHRGGYYDRRYRSSRY